MLMKIISGGSHGADIGALKFATESKIEIGGFIKKGYDNEYKLEEKDVSHAIKDKLNVDLCDSLLAFRYSIPKTGRGTDMTINYTANGKYAYTENKKSDDNFTLLQGNKPVLILWDITLENIDLYTDILTEFVKDKTSLMISGPIPETVSDIEDIVYTLLKKVYKNLIK